VNISGYSYSKEISRLISTAVVSKTFCNQLLTDPATALQSGFQGETFELLPEEEVIVLSIRATCIQDFASQLLEYLQVR
jgi:hypothetical protein